MTLANYDSWKLDSGREEEQDLQEEEETVVCKSCKCTYLEEDVLHGICVTCLNIYAKQGTADEFATAYLKYRLYNPHFDRSYIEEAAEYASQWLIGKAGDTFLAGQFVFMFLDIVEGRQIRYPRFFLYSKEDLDKAIKSALLDFCSEDLDDFAEFISERIDKPEALVAETA